MVEIGIGQANLTGGLNLTPDLLVGAKLCNTTMPGRCITHLGSVPLYRDADHLSNAGVQLIVEDILRELSARGFVAAQSPQRP